MVRENSTRNPQARFADKHEVPQLIPAPVLHQYESAFGLPMSFIARQPILDVHQNVFGYELLFRAGWENIFTGDNDASTRQMIDSTLFHGIEALTCGTRAFVNCTREALVGRLVTFLPPASTVLEVLETVVVDDEVLASVRDLKALGYKIALDDFLPGSGSDCLLDLADYIKLDLRASTAAELTEYCHVLRHTPASLLAEKVETPAEFKFSLKAGFQYFQGYFFARPTVVVNREIPANRLIYLQLLGAIADPATSWKQLVDLAMTDASICFRILRLVNSASFGANGRISSIRQALLMMGQLEFHKLLTIAAAACFQKSGNFSPELTLMCLHRARFCELVAPLAGQDAPEQYLIGLLSVVDAMLQAPMTRILQVLPLQPAAESVLLGEDSPAELPLRLIRCYEQSDWEACSSLCHALGLPEADLARIYVQSLQWATLQVREFAQV